MPYLSDVGNRYKFTDCEVVHTIFLHLVTIGNYDGKLTNNHSAHGNCYSNVKVTKSRLRKQTEFMTCRDNSEVDSNAFYK